MAEKRKIHINPKNKGKFNALKKRTGKTTEELKHSKNPLTRKRATFAANAKKWKHEDGGPIMPYALGGMIPAQVEKQEVVVPPGGIQAGVRRKFNLPSHKKATSENNIMAQPGSFVLSDKLMYDDKQTFAQAYEAAGQKVDKFQKIVDNPKATSLAIKTAQRNLKNIKSQQQEIMNANMAQLPPEEQQKFALGGPIGSAMSAIPALYNIGMGLFGKAEHLNANDYMNPEANKAIGLMSNRRFNIDPMLANNANQAAAAMGNVVNQGGGRGMINANRQALLSARMGADAGAFAQQQNVNNEYMGQEAQFRAGIGQQKANTRLQIKDINMQSDAAKRNQLATGLGQLGQMGQVQGLMSNQKERDSQMMVRWQEYMDMMKATPKVQNTAVPPMEVNPGGFFNQPDNYQPDPYRT
jgi:hypothetical protein